MNSKTLALAAAALLTAGCVEDIKFNGNETESVPVMFGYAVAGDSLRLDLSMSVFFLHEEHAWRGGYSHEFYNGLLDKDISVGAFVNGSPSSVPFKLTAHPSDTSTNIEDGSDVCFRYVSDYVAEPGDVIDFRVSISGRSEPLKSKIRVPFSPSVALVSADTTSVDEERKVVIAINDNAFETNHYAFKAELTYVGMMLEDYEDPDSWVADEDTCTESVSVSFQQESLDIVGELTSSGDSYLSDNMFDGKTHNVVLTVGGFYNWSWYKRKPLSLKMTVVSVSESEYYYYTSLEKLGNDLLSFFGEAVQLYTNVSGGYGCVMANSSASAEIRY